MYNVPLALTTGDGVLEVVDGVPAVVLGESIQERLVLRLLLVVRESVLVARLRGDDGLLIIGELVDDVLEATALELREKGDAVVPEADTVVEIRSAEFASRVMMRNDVEDDADEEECRGNGMVPVTGAAAQDRTVHREVGGDG